MRSPCVLTFLVLALIAAACGAPTPAVSPTHAPVALTPSAAPSLEPTGTQTATDEPTPLGPTETEIPQPANLAAITNPDTLRFVFPTPGPAPRSAWRPPLYDVPWALTPHDHFYFARPIGADEVNWPLADYRYGAVWPGKEDVIHTGIDIDAPAGTPVLAAAPGKVIFAGLGLMYGENTPNDPYGLAVLIQHDFGFNGKRLDTIYAHLSQVDVVPGQVVTTGTRLGLVGETGFTTGPHLHFEVRLREMNYYTTRNPELWLAPPQGWGLLVGRLTGWDGSPLPKIYVNVSSKENSDWWVVRTYANSQGLRSDPYYQENLVLSDLPEGDYTITFRLDGIMFSNDISIHPGLVTYFSFQRGRPFGSQPPPTPIATFLPVKP